MNKKTSNNVDFTISCNDSCTHYLLHYFFTFSPLHCSELYLYLKGYLSNVITVCFLPSMEYGLQETVMEREQLLLNCNLLFDTYFLTYLKVLSSIVTFNAVFGGQTHRKGLREIGLLSSLAASAAAASSMHSDAFSGWPLSNLRKQTRSSFCT